MNLKNGDNFKIIITLHAKVYTEIEEGVTRDQLCDLVLQDDAYGLKSIIAGKVNPDCEFEHDTEIVWDENEVEIMEPE